MRYSEGGTSFLTKETMTMVAVRLSRIELRKKLTKPTCNFQNKRSNAVTRQARFEKHTAERVAKLLRCKHFPRCRISQPVMVTVHWKKGFTEAIWNFCLVATKTSWTEHLQIWPCSRKSTHHPKQTTRLSSSYIVGNQLKSLMSIHYLYDGHRTKQEKNYFTDFCRCTRQLWHSDFSRRSLPKKIE